jgi:very-short-patch-repair endonuclease
VPGNKKALDLGDAQGAALLHPYNTGIKVQQSWKGTGYTVHIHGGESTMGKQDRSRKLLFKLMNVKRSHHQARGLSFCHHFKLCKPPAAITPKQLCTEPSVYKHELRCKKISKAQLTVMRLVDTLLPGHEWVWEAIVLKNWPHPVDIAVPHKQLVIQVDGEQHFHLPMHKESIHVQMCKDRDSSAAAVGEGWRCMRLHAGDVEAQPEECKSLIMWALGAEPSPCIILSHSYCKVQRLVGCSTLAFMQNALRCSVTPLHEEDAVGYLLTV